MALAWATLQSPAAAAQINAVWGGTANWTSSANWSLSPVTPAGFQYPDNDTPTAGETYIANITTGSPTLNSKAIAIDALNLAANLTINAPGSLSLVSTSIPSTWSGGSIGGSGSFNIGSGVTLDLTTTAVRGASATINNNGIVSLTAGGDLSPANWNNNAGSVFELQASANLRGGKFANGSGAMFRKTGAAGTSSVDAIFNNQGNVLNDTANGTLSFSAYSSNNGAYGGTTTITNAGAMVQFLAGRTGFNFEDSTTHKINVFGAGQFNLWSGVDSVADGNTLTIGDELGTTPGRLTMSNQAALVGPGNIQVNKLSNFTWSGGGSLSMLGNNTGGTTTVASGARFDIIGVGYLAETVNNNGSATLSKGGNLFASAGAAWHNKTGAVFELPDGSHLRNDRNYSGTRVFTNDSGATFKISGGHSSFVEWALNNSGAVLVTDAAMWLSGGGSYGGSTTIADAAGEIFIGQNSVTFQDSATKTTTVSGAGMFNIFDGTHTVAAGNTLTIGDALGNAPGNLALSIATLGGPGNLQVNPRSTFIWMGGSTLGNNTGGATTMASGANFYITGNSSRFLSEAVNNFGTTQVAMASTIFRSPGAAWNNKAGSVFDLQADASLRNSGGDGEFINGSGATFKKSGGSGTSTIEWAFNNSGNLQVQSGTLEFTDALTNAGTLTVGVGATLAAGTLNSTGAIMGNGTLAGGSGAITVNLNGGVISPGQSAGELIISGDVNSNGDATFAFEIGGNMPANSMAGPPGIGAGHYDFLNVAGTLKIGPTNPTLDVALVDGFIPAASDTFCIIDSAGELSASDIFAGLAEGATVLTSDHRGSFVVHYNRDTNGFNRGAVMLDGFKLIVPEPSSLTLYCLAVECFVVRRRLRRNRPGEKECGASGQEN